MIFCNFPFSVHYFLAILCFFFLVSNQESQRKSVRPSVSISRTKISMDSCRLFFLQLIIYTMNETKIDEKKKKKNNDSHFVLMIYDLCSARLIETLQITFGLILCRMLTITNSRRNKIKENFTPFSSFK